MTTFALVATPTLTQLGTIRLRGDFTVDALSPNGNTLYLIQHLTGNDVAATRCARTTCAPGSC